MGSSFWYSVLPSVEAVIPILKVAAVLSSCYTNSRASETRKDSWRRKFKLHTTLQSAGIPHYDSASLSGVGKGYLEKPLLPARAAAKPLPWPLRPHVAG